MADFTGKEWTVTSVVASQRPQTTSEEPDGIAVTPTFGDISSGTVLYYLMRWLDVDCSPTITYRTWVVTQNPDPTGGSYTGSKCGGTSITGAVIAAVWSA